MIGQTISHYKILEKLGEGGMGAVYLAQDTRLERRVALKFLPPHVAREPESLARFEHEAKATAALHHPNIVTIHEIGVHEDRHYIVMAYIEGELLHDMINERAMTIEQSLAITLELCDALGEAHKAGIIHRDLKPANIIVNKRGRPHVLDFGLALRSGAARLTQDGTTVGSLNYMSPEQSRGDSVDQRTDIFSLGAILYEMVAGRPAFQGKHAAAIQYKIANEDPQPMTRYSNQVPPELERIVAKSLAKDPGVRYQTMDGLAAALRPLCTASTGAGRDQRTAMQRLRAAGAAVMSFLLRPVVISGVALGVIGFAAGAFLTDSSVEPDEIGGTPLPARYSIPVPVDMPIVPRPECSAVAISPDGQLIVYVTSDMMGSGRDDSPSLRTYLTARAVDSYEIVRIDGTRGAAGPFFSPDGNWIGFVDYDDGKLKKVVRGGGAPVTLCGGTSYYRHASWGDDGNIYFGLVDGIYVVPEAGGTPTRLTGSAPGGNEKTRRFPHVLPGSRALLFTLGSNSISSYDDAQVALYDVATGETRVLVEGGTNPWYLPTGHIAFGRAGELFAVSFDLENLEVTGTPVSVLDGLITSDGYGAAHFAVSRNGTLAFVPGGPEHYYSTISTIDLEGNIEPLNIPPRLFGHTQVSPDGERLVTSTLDANANLWVYEMQRGTMTRMTSAWDNYSPRWHPSGDRITFGSNRGGSTRVWQIAADGAGEPEKLTDVAENVFVGTWSDDGQWFCYSPVSQETSSDVWVVSGDEEHTAKPVIVTPFQEFDPAFSPDGRWIAYVSDESGRPEVYVQPFPVTGQKWKLSRDGGDSPNWSPDGRKLYYLRGQNIMSVSIETDPSFAPGRAEELLEIKHTDITFLDVFPDGKRFLFVGSARGTEERLAVVTGSGHYRVFPTVTPEVRVVINWFEALP